MGPDNKTITQQLLERVWDDEDGPCPETEADQVAWLEFFAMRGEACGGELGYARHGAEIGWDNFAAAYAGVQALEKHRADLGLTVRHFDALVGGVVGIVREQVRVLTRNHKACVSVDIVAILNILRDKVDVSWHAACKANIEAEVSRLRG